MAWETRGGRGHYYTRSRRQGGRVVREYVGTGTTGAAVAAEDAAQRALRAADRDAQRAERERLDVDQAVIETLHARVDLLVRAALVSAGYHQHNRGDWRKRRRG
jgi:hypothetical protein